MWSTASGMLPPSQVVRLHFSHRWPRVFNRYFLICPVCPVFWNLPNRISFSIAVYAHFLEQQSGSYFFMILWNTALHTLQTLFIAALGPCTFPRLLNAAAQACEQNVFFFDYNSNHHCTVCNGSEIVHKAIVYLQLFLSALCLTLGTQALSLTSKSSFSTMSQVGLARRRTRVPRQSTFALPTTTRMYLARRFASCSTLAHWDVEVAAQGFEPW